MSSGQWEVVGKNKKDKNVQNGKSKNKDERKNETKSDEPGKIYYFFIYIPTIRKK